MFYNTKFLKLLNSFYFNILNKFKFIEKYFVIYIFLLLFGFICGNLFGTFLIFFRFYTNWDGLIIILTILIIEFINFISYIKSLKYRKFNRFFLKIYKNKFFFLLFKNLKFLNFYKMGLLLGFFIDAFKVGS